MWNQFFVNECQTTGSMSAMTHINMSCDLIGQGVAHDMQVTMMAALHDNGGCTGNSSSGGGS